MGRYDPAIRAWARCERKVAAAVRGRSPSLRALAALFEEAGFGAAEARTARGLCTFLLGEPQVRAPARESGELICERTYGRIAGAAAQIPRGDPPHPERAQARRGGAGAAIAVLEEAASQD